MNIDRLIEELTMLKHFLAMKPHQHTNLEVYIDNKPLQTLNLKESKKHLIVNLSSAKE